MSGQVEALAELFEAHDSTDCHIGLERPCTCKCGFELPRCVPSERKRHRDALVSDWLRDHDRALRESIAADIEAERDRERARLQPDPEIGLIGNYLGGFTEAAKVARGEQP